MRIVGTIRSTTLGFDGVPRVDANDDDGTVDVTFAANNTSAFVRRSLAVGAHIIDPPMLVQQAQSMLGAHQRAYGVA